MGRQVLGQGQQIGVKFPLNLTKSARSFSEEAEGLTPFLTSYLTGEVEEAWPLGGLDNLSR